MNIKLLAILADEEGFESSDELIECFVLDSVQPGICRSCEATTSSVEPDQRAGWCHSCGEPKVASVAVLAGLV